METVITTDKHNAIIAGYAATIDALTKENALLKDELALLKEENEILKKTVAALTAKVDELEAKLKKNSKNSSKPPSSDGIGKAKVTQSLRERTGRAPGGQNGHRGSGLELKNQPDKVVVLHVKNNCECGGNITVNSGAGEKRQETDIEPSKVITIEYRAEEGKCKNCGKIHKASFPEGVDATAVYGPGLQAVLTYMTNYQHLPLERATEFVKEIYGIEISQGTIISANKEVYKKLEEVYPLIKDELINSDVVGFDESGMRVAGELNWLHCAATKDAVYYTIHKKRGKEGMDDAGILPNFKGTAIHDHWKAYYKYVDCAHGECNAHHLRQLVFICEVLGQDWAKEMLCLLMRIKRHVDYSRLFDTNELPKEDIKEYEGMYRAIVIAAAEAIGMPNPYDDGDTGNNNAVAESKADDVELELASAGCIDGITGSSYQTGDCVTTAANNSAASPVKKKRQKKTESERMLTRLAHYELETLMFMYDFDVPFDNNLVESAIRMPKLHQKISGCFRTKEGADVFARIRSFIGTTKKKGKNIMDGIRAALEGHGVEFLYPGRS